MNNFSFGYGGIGNETTLYGDKKLIISNNVIREKVPVNVTTSDEIRCQRCDHMAKYHINAGCNWRFKQDGGREYSCLCYLSCFEVIKHYNRKPLQYNFDLL